MVFQTVITVVNEIGMQLRTYLLHEEFMSVSLPFLRNGWLFESVVLRVTKRR